MLIIAEAGVNHNGDIELAKKLVDEAKWAGADIVKFQMWHKDFKDLPYHIKNLSYDEFKELKRYCDNKKITFLSTPFDIESVEFLDEIGVPAFKVRSLDLKHYWLLDSMVETKKPIIISTGNPDNESGMAALADIKETVDYLRGNYFILLQCVSKYPCFDSRIDRIQELKTKFNVPIGLSDHTKNIYINGIDNIPVLEKHLMLNTFGIEPIDKNMSLYPDEFKKMVEFVRFKKWC